MRSITVLKIVLVVFLLLRIFEALAASLNPGVQANGSLFNKRGVVKRNLAGDLNQGLKNPWHYLDSAGLAIDANIGNGTTNARAALAAASVDGPIVLIPGIYRASSNVTLSAVYFSPGARIKPDSGIVVTIPSYQAADEQYVFDISAGGSFNLSGTSPTPYQFGAVRDGTTDISDECHACINAANSLRFLSGFHVATIVANPVGGLKVTGVNTRLQAAVDNTFALTIAGEFPSSVCTVSGIEFWGNETKSIHGLQIAAGSAVFVENCWSSYCGIGLLNNNSIDLRFSNFWIQQCYVGVYMTSRLAATSGLDIDDIAGQTVTVAECLTGGVPFGASHPSENLFSGIVCNLCDIGFVCDQPANTVFGASQDFVFAKPLIQACKVGVWLKGDPLDRRMTATITKFISPWHEGCEPEVDRIVDGDTTAGCDIRIDGGLVVYDGGLIESMRVKGTGQLRLRDVTYIPRAPWSETLEIDSTASVVAETITASYLVNFRCQCCLPLLPGYGAIFRWHGPGHSSRVMQNSPRLLTSYSCTGTDIPAYYAGNDLGVIADGVLETEECRGMCCVYLNGILVPMTVAEGELYSLAFAIRAYCPEIVFTADSGTEIFTAVAHGLFNGQEMNVWSDDTLPDGLAEDTNYYIINKTDDTFQLAATVGGSAISIGDNGTGVPTIQQVKAFNCAVINNTPNAFVSFTEFPVTDVWEHWCCNGIALDTGDGSVLLMPANSPAGVLRAFLVSAIQGLHQRNTGEMIDFNTSGKFFKL